MYDILLNQRQKLLVPKICNQEKGNQDDRGLDGACGVGSPPSFRRGRRLMLLRFKVAVCFVSLDLQGSSVGLIPYNERTGASLKLLFLDAS